MHELFSTACSKAQPMRAERMLELLYRGTANNPFDYATYEKRIKSLKNDGEGTKLGGYKATFTITKNAQGDNSFEMSYDVDEKITKNYPSARSYITTTIQAVEDSCQSIQTGVVNPDKNWQQLLNGIFGILTVPSWFTSELYVKMQIMHEIPLMSHIEWKSQGEEGEELRSYMLSPTNFPAGVNAVGQLTITFNVNLYESKIGGQSRKRGQSSQPDRSSQRGRTMQGMASNAMA